MKRKNSLLLVGSMMLAAVVLAAALAGAISPHGPLNNSIAVSRLPRRRGYTGSASTVWGEMY